MIKRTIWSLILIIGIFGVLAITKGHASLPGFLPILPPLVAITLSFITHEVAISLFVGIVLGAAMTFEVSGPITLITALGKGTLKSLDGYMVSALADSDHISIVIFTAFIGGLVALIGQSGGLQGIVNTLSKYAKNSVLTQFYTWLLGIFIFFDDYANSLIIGNAMRPLTDKYRVSREKLSFIVDATAAPVTSLVFISTWIGYEVGIIQDVFKTNAITADPYLSFLYSIPYRFYVIVLLIFIPIAIFMRRDFGPMLKAEIRARDTGETLRKDSQPIIADQPSAPLDSNIQPRAINAIVPIILLIVGVLISLYVTGYMSLAEKSLATNATIKDILGASNSFKALIWSSFASSVVLMIMIVVSGSIKFKRVIQIWLNGFQSMATAIIILTLAWSLGGVLKDIKTAQVITDLLKDLISYQYLPLVIFLISSITSFATGTSWGTMAILFPIAIPLAQQLSINAGGDVAFIMQASIGAILSGAVFGDHCSPISDTTILSSIASNVDHMDHVSTQLPYALMIGLFCCVLGYLPAGFGLNPYLLSLVTLAGTVLFIRFVGKKV